MPAALFFTLFFSLVICTVEADDSLAMVKLAAAISPAPKGWSAHGTTNYCDWEGVQCTESLRVFAIALPDRNLSGNLPPEIASLSHLQVLSLEFNRLTGPLPSLANLSSLRQLYLFANNFTSIPQNFFSGLVSLSDVRIGYNPKMSPWTIPPDIGQCTSLVFFMAVGVNIFGFIPDTLASLPSLTTLKLSYNNLTGTLPGSFANSGINYLILNSQQVGLSGSIDVLSSMTGLAQAWLQGNQFTGPIPDLSRCQYLTDLQLSDNQFTGFVPASLTSLPGLSNVSLSNNRLQGPVPAFKANVWASIGGNNYCLDNPGVPCDPQVNMLLEIARDIRFPAAFFTSWRGNNACSSWKFVTCDSSGSLATINFTRQNFSGFISPAFGNLTSIRKLYLNDNNLTGFLPDSLRKLPHLEILDVSNNNLTGNLPNFASSVKLVVSPGNPLLSYTVSSATENRGNRVTPLVISGIVILAISFSALVAFALFKCKKKKRRARGNILGYQFIKFLSRCCHGENAPYSVQLLRRATENFNEKNILGKGGFGVVYKGKLKNGTEIAVKRMKATAIAENGKINEFQAEISVLSKVTHKHLVSLLGYCESGDERFLIYEYMPKGTLQQHLLEWREIGWPHLTWKQRVRITLDIAYGLEYLHNLTEQNLSFLHRDIKPSNILLGDDMRAKISDFGLVKKSSNGLTSVETRVAGTFGYLAPEYTQTGKLTKTVDAYAFGVILMEMITGRKAIDSTRELEDDEWMEIHLVTWFRRVLLNNEVYNKIDQVLNPDEEDLESIYKVAELAGKCTVAKPRERPDIGYVVNSLVPLVEQRRTASKTEKETFSQSISTMSDEISVNSEYYAVEPMTANWQQKHATI